MRKFRIVFDDQDEIYEYLLRTIMQYEATKANATRLARGGLLIVCSLK